MTSFQVKIAQLSEHDIHTHVKMGEPIDKVGRYLCCSGDRRPMIECMEVDFFAVMGLPMHRQKRIGKSSKVDPLFVLSVCTLYRSKT